MKFTRKFITVALVLTMVFTLMPVTALASDTITVTIDGQRVTFADQQPVIINNRTLVPVGGVFEALGFTPSWSGSAQTATLTRTDYTVIITIGSATFTTNGVEHTLDVPAQIINNRTMLPLRAVLESIGIAPENIGWDGNAHAITITTGTEDAPPVDPVDAEAELTAFLSGMDMNLIRDALGVNFTVGMTEYVIDLDRNAVQSYRILYLGGELDIDISTEGSHAWTNMFNTQTGDVTLHRLVVEHPTTPVARYLVRVDIGSAFEVAEIIGWPQDNMEYWTTEAHRVHHFILVTDLYQSVDVEANLAAFIDGMDMSSIRDALGVNFTIGTREYTDAVNTTAYRFLQLDGELNIDFEPEAVLDAFNTQTGDVILIRTLILNRYLLRIDLGSVAEAAEIFGREAFYWVSENRWYDDNLRVYHIFFWTDM